MCGNVLSGEAPTWLSSNSSRFRSGDRRAEYCGWQEFDDCCVRVLVCQVITHHSVPVQPVNSQLRCGLLLQQQLAVNGRKRLSCGAVQQCRGGELQSLCRGLFWQRNGVGKSQLQRQLFRRVLLSCGFELLDTVCMSCRPVQFEWMELVHPLASPQ